ncbi:DUF72 domain-containing protein [Flavobacterium caseinilyticum]|uniref:DUF72 domain-containing protein n=1 Tax=Flavobacterium caseinilyticum TaxID=2541732 RepID=A0A4R5AVJ1_9FLAO|nr:DUF72 domain-containing protein [Flavobacterium caseinilyticum]TDD75184.1 DUF72 domain-containing protein [Flavobacterium caseinilyticum]
MFAKNIHIGYSSFHNTKWKNVFYPENILPSKWFNFYCTHFNTFEINATFYKFPTLRIFENWYKKSPDGFIYSVKAPKLITHIKKFVDCKSEIDEFFSLCKQGLNEKLECILFQLPLSFHYSPEKLDLIIESMSPDFKIAIELRHPGWWSQEVYERLARNNITFASVSRPAMPTDIIATSTVGYVRLHGIPKMFYSEYSFTDLIKLHDVIIEKKLLEQVFIYCNNTASEAEVLNAKKLTTIFKS